MLDPVSDVKSIAVLTSGGDSPGMNAAVRAVVRSAATANIKVHVNGCASYCECLISSSFKTKKITYNYITGHIMSQDVESKVKAIIVDKLGVDDSEVTADANFTNDLGADSLDTVELIMEFEKEFDLSIPDEDAENIATVGDAVTYLSGKLS